LEEAKTLPLGAVWQEYCRRQNVSGDSSWIAEVKNYKKTFLSKRN
jgi:L-rhamnose isomerase